MLKHILSKIDQHVHTCFKPEFDQSSEDLDEMFAIRKNIFKTLQKQNTLMKDKMCAVESRGQYLDVSERVSDALPALAVVRVLHYILCDILQRAGAALSTHRHHLFAFIKVYCKEVVIRVVYRRPRRVPCESTVLVG